MVQWAQQCLCNTRTQVQSPAGHSGLRIWGCHSCSIGHNCSSDLIPGGNSTCCKEAKQTNKQKQTVLTTPSPPPLRTSALKSAWENILLLGAFGFLLYYICQVWVWCFPSVPGLSESHFTSRCLYTEVAFMAQWLKNLTRIHEDVGSIPGLTQQVKDLALPWAVV